MHYLLSCSLLLPYLYFFFLMLPPPPKSTLLPYTTLFRSRWPCAIHSAAAYRPLARPECRSSPSVRHRRRRPASRSEEHTSELQSRRDLVCRLLLEKKKKKTKQKHKI